MAECHPVGFQWVMEAQASAARQIIHVDPRFTRTSAIADQHVPIRVGHRHRVPRRADQPRARGRALVPRVRRRLHERRDDRRRGLRGHRGPRRPVLRLGRGGGDATTRELELRGRAACGRGRRARAAAGPEAASRPTARTAPSSRGDAARDRRDARAPALRVPDPARHFARYTPEMVERVCGDPAEQFPRVADALVRNSGRERTTAFVYSVGWTQHTVGVQYIRTASILQLLLGNIGRPGGGIMALRGHASIQGSTDIPTLYNILPGYLPMPQAGTATDLDDYLEHNTPPAGFWGHTRRYMISLLKAWWGDAATPRTTAFDHLPRIDRRPLDLPDDHGHARRRGRGLLRAWARTRPSARPTPSCTGSAMAKLKWLVVRDLQLIESATFWKDGPEIETGELRTEDIGTEVFFLPAAAHTEKDGTFTNTQRLLQWHDKAVEPPGDCRSELHFMLPPDPPHPGEARRLDRAARPPAPGPDLGLPDARADRGARRRGGLREISGLAVADGEAVSALHGAEGDGSTALRLLDLLRRATPDGVNQTARRRPGAEQNWVAPEWGWAWPRNRRMLYNRASADPDGNAVERAQALRLVGRGGGQVDGRRRPRLQGRHAARLRAADGRARPRPRCAATSRSSCRPTARAGCTRRPGSPTGRCPTHYEPHESPVRNRAATRQQANPARQVFDRPDNRYNPPAGDPGADVFPFVLMTYRIAEHHTAGGMSRFLPYLPSSRRTCSSRSRPRWPRCAGSSTATGRRSSPRARAIEARALVTDRMRRWRRGPPVHTVGAALPLGPERAGHGRLRQRPVAARARPQRPHLRSSRPRPATSGPAGGRAGRRCSSYVDEYRRRAGEPAAWCRTATAMSDARRLLHRHVAVHRLQGVRGRLQGVEPGPRGRPRLPRAVDGQHRRRSARHLAPRRLHRAAGAEDAGRRDALADDLRRLQALHGGRLPGGLPDRLAVPHRVRHGRRAGGHLQRLRLLRPRLPVRRASTGARTTAGCGSARSATTGSATTRSRPARRRARRTRSSSASSRSCASTRASASRRCTSAARTGAQLYLDGPDDGIGGAGAFFLLLDEPEVYGLPPDPVDADAPPAGESWRAAAARPRGGARGGVLGRGRREPAMKERRTVAARRAALLLRPADPQAAGLDLGGPRRTSSSAGWPGRALAARGCARLARQRARSPAARRAVALAGVGRLAAAADLRPRAPRALLHMLRVFKLDLADERRHVDPRGVRRRDGRRRPGSCSACSRAPGAARGGRRRARRPAARPPTPPC